jgi:fatty-acyl-CoA synthase
MYIQDWLGRRAQLTPEKTALIEAATGARFSYAELNERATRLANHLRNVCGVRSGDRVAVLALNRVETLEALFACAKLLAVLVPLNYRLTAPELAYIIGDCAPQVLLYEPEFEALVGPLHEAAPVPHALAIAQRGYEQALAQAQATLGATEGFDPEQPLLIIYTSGTTGHHKGCCTGTRSIRTSHLIWCRATSPRCTRRSFTRAG